VSVDAGVKLDGWFADAARTFAVGDVDERNARLLDVTRRRSRRHRAGPARQPPRRHRPRHPEVAEAAGFGVVRDLVGHGIGREPHEEPQVPNFGRRAAGSGSRPASSWPSSPWSTPGGAGVRTLADRWTVVSADGSRSAHFEQTVAITEIGPRVLTA
jgi:methionyl aminopeptidase